MNQRIAISILVLILVVCIVLSMVCIMGAGLIIQDSNSILDFSNQTGTITSDSPTKETNQIQLPDGTNQGGSESNQAITDQIDNIPPEVLVEMELIQIQVSQSRGLEATSVFTRVLFSQDQINQRVIDDFLEDYTEEDAYQDVIVLEAFGLLDSDFDMYNFYRSLMQEQIAGFYDDETKEMVVVQDTGFGGIERLTYAHEFTHALQDQNFDINNGLNYNDDACENDSERCAAVQALLEGDATLSELNWYKNHSTSEDQADILTFYDTYESPVLDKSPSFFAEDFLFPYENGFEFVQYLYDRGGWKSVDKAYQDIPVSTEQILHPERYPDDKPTKIFLPEIDSTLGDGWKALDEGILGEWYTYLILAHGLNPNAQLDGATAETAAEGWGGDAYIVYHNQEESSKVMILRTEWESSIDAAEFRDAFITYAHSRFGAIGENDSNEFIWDSGLEINYFKVEENFTTWILAPNTTLAEAIMSILSGN